MKGKMSMSDLLIDLAERMFKLSEDYDSYGFIDYTSMFEDEEEAFADMLDNFGSMIPEHIEYLNEIIENTDPDGIDSDLYYRAIALKEDLRPWQRG